ncbi:TPA: hypothetical protein ACG3I4_001941 [Clostridioides difficile]|nr:hypothetical protein [Clostridioides difficile]MCU5873524.1 hypothetical protein [Clostridioides difficile]MCU5897809.1 hypothetical protein [Clostridioides difficile]HBF6215046.1 hypothetical protein [Clostridioides difficile]HBF6481517.1 hypothetical protein [Clostridioides difficile]HBF6526414.1 hypothetical protein [Clostridioides difficile]
MRVIVDNEVSSTIIAKVYQEKYEIELTKMYIKLIGLRSVTMYYQNRIVD